MTPELLSKKFSEDVFAKITGHLIQRDFTRDTRSVSLPDSTKYITNVKNLGRYEELELQVLIVKHTSANDARVGLSKELFSILKKYSISNALVATYSDDDSWRYSLLTTNLRISKSGKVLREFSNPKRHSYLLGPNTKVATPYKYLIVKGGVKDFDDLADRFSVEVVNDEFYKKISVLYDELVGTKEEKGTLRYPGEGETSHEFAVRLIGRIIFCWFLREKKSDAGTSLISSRLLSRDAADQDNYYHSVLAPLFFEVLNKRINFREDRFRKDDYKLIPYLNGGLFNPDSDDHYEFDTVIQASVPGLIEVPDEWLRKLFDLLELFNFTIDENTAYDIDLSIDPEMLGRIFENLLARINPETGEMVRKTTGSFYTPREVVDYMVDEALSQYLLENTKLSKEKIDALVSYDLSDDAYNPLSFEEKKSVLDCISSIKILDPACGSGAFPIGALQKIVFILQQVDPESDYWLGKQLANASSEFRRHLEKEFKGRNFDYLRKLGVIRECIYGIDVQPIATEISRLRCFLTLVVDQSVDDKDENRGIEPLPNLDFKFVTANSLIGLPDSNTSSYESQKGLFEEDAHIVELKKIINQYFSAPGNERLNLQSNFQKLQKKMLLQNIDVYKGSASSLYDTLSRWDPFSHEVADWFDSEWMFGVENFDVVIANPPYVDSETMTNDSPKFREYLKDQFNTTTGNWDLFVPFVEKGLNELKANGIFVYIVPNKIIGAKYSTKLREYINHQNLLEVRDYSRLNVFREADVYPVTIAIKKSVRGSGEAIFRTMESFFEPKRTNTAPNDLLIKDAFWDKYFLDEAEFKIIRKLMNLPKLTDSRFKITGAATVSEAYEVKKYLKDQESPSREQKKLINTGTIDPYKSLWGIKPTQYIKDSYKNPVISDEDIKTINITRHSQATSQKIIIAGMSSSIEAFYDGAGDYLAGKSTTIILGEEKDLRYLVALLNSKLITYLTKTFYHSLKMAGGYLNVSKSIIENLPIPADISLDTKNKLIDLVGAEGAPSPENIDKINHIIYRIYGLTEEEIDIIEASV